MPSLHHLAPDPSPPDAPPVVILAGGLATRMRPRTESLPKYLLPVAGVPFADHQLGWLARHGVRDVLLCLGHLARQVRDHVGDGARWGLRISCVEDGPVPLGTAGALRAALDAGVLPERFLLTYGDSFLPIDPREPWRAFGASGRPALMSVFRNEGRWEVGNAEYRDGLVVRYDKRPAGDGSAFAWVDYGMLGLTRALIAQRVPPAPAVTDLAPLLHALSLEGALAGWESPTRFFEIGSPEGLETLETWLAAHPS